MKNALILGHPVATEPKGDDKKIKILASVLKEQNTVIVDEIGEFESIRTLLPKNVSIVKTYAEADKFKDNQT